MSTWKLNPLIKAGYHVFYAADVIVRHAAARPILGRMDGNKGELYYMVRNKIWFAYDHLPTLNAITFSFIWILRFGDYAIRSKTFRDVAAGLRDGLTGVYPRKKAASS